MGPRVVFQNGADDVKKHRWFKVVDWEAVPLRKMKVSRLLSSHICGVDRLPLSPQPPIVPKVSHEGDTSNFDVYPEDDWKKDPAVPQKDLEIFKNF